MNGIIKLYSGRIIGNRFLYKRGKNTMKTFNHYGIEVVEQVIDEPFKNILKKTIYLIWNCRF